jgi:hypothetical protein
MMPESDRYARFLRGVTRLIIVLGLIGSACVSLWKGPKTGASFLVGAAVSYLSFWRWQRVVGAIGGDGSSQPKSLFFIVRLILVAALAYAIIKYLELNFAAAASGLFTSAAAVILELIFESMYAS